MVRAVIQNGVIHPIDPLPNDWRDGQEVVVGKADNPNAVPVTEPSVDIDAWMDEVERLAKEIDPEDARLFAQAIQERQQQLKELAARGKR